MRYEIAKVIGGIGQKKSNSGTQYYQQDRVYDGRNSIALCVPSNIPGGSYRYLFEVDDDKRCNRNNTI